MNKEKEENEYKHWCGCITTKYKKGVAFKKMCEMHRQNGNYIWIVFQHPEEKGK